MEKVIEPKLERTNAMPLHMQLKIIMREKMASGEWEINSMIPSENELGQIYGISRMTTRNVVTQLVSEGLLYRVPGKGTFVAEPKIEMSSLSYLGIRSQLESKGFKVETKLLEAVQIKADDFIAQKLGIKTNAKVFKIRRVRSTNGKPISYHQSYVPVELAKDLTSHDLCRDQLCQILSDNYSLSRAKVTESLESYLADVDEARVFGVEPGFPLLLLQDLISTHSGVIFEYTRIYYRGDKITVKLEYDN